MAKERFDAEKTSLRELKDQPIEVIKTEVPELAKALGIDTVELFRNISGVGRGGLVADGDCRCCGNDSW